MSWLPWVPQRLIGLMESWQLRLKRSPRLDIVARQWQSATIGGFFSHLCQPVAAKTNKKPACAKEKGQCIAIHAYQWYQIWSKNTSCRLELNQNYLEFGQLSEFAVWASAIKVTSVQVSEIEFVLIKNLTCRVFICMLYLSFCVLP